MSTPQIPIDSGFGLAATTAFAANAVILFLYGLTVAPAYYLPMIVFSIEFGGKHCGVLIGLIDAAGYAAAMLFQFGGGALIDRPGGWQRMLALLLATAILAAVTTVWFALQDAAAQRSQLAPVRAHPEHSTAS